MFRLVVLSALLAIAFASPRQIHPRFDNRIVGGEPTDIEKYPYQVSLEWFGSHICGGSIIGPRHVVTAAHCTDGSSAEELTVRGGTSKRENGGSVIKVAEIHQHPQFDNSNIDYDVSVLELATEFNWGENIMSIWVATEEPAAGTEAVCTGWGTTQQGGSSLPEILQEVTVPIVSRQQCSELYQNELISDRMICAGYIDGGKDACQGDSGGPLAANGQLVGIVSWGYGCAQPNYPGVYSNVANLHDFIIENS